MRGQVAATTVSVTSEGPTRPTRVDAKSTTLVSAAGDAVLLFKGSRTTCFIDS